MSGKGWQISSAVVSFPLPARPLGNGMVGAEPAVVYWLCKQIFRCCEESLGLSKQRWDTVVLHLLEEQPSTQRMVCFLVISGIHWTSSTLARVLLNRLLCSESSASASVVIARVTSASVPTSLTLGPCSESGLLNKGALVSPTNCPSPCVWLPCLGFL